MIEDDEIAIAMTEPDSPKGVVRDAIHRSLRKGGFDNITAVCLFS
jgi:serine/threonine protein phosphatase PrpC